MNRIVPPLALFALGLVPPQAHAQAAGDPRKAAFEALAAASSVVPSGSTEGGAIRVIGFDVAPRGSTPAEQARNFLADYGAALGLTGRDQGLVLRSARVEGPLTVVSFAQTYKGVPVFAGEVRVGIAASRTSGLPRVVLAGGALLPDLALEGGLDVEASLSPAACTETARAHLGRPGAAPLADPKLMIHDPRLLGGAAAPRLVWSVTIAGQERGDGAIATQVLCDAHTGAVAFEQPFSEPALDLWEGLQFPNPSHTYLGDENGLDAQGQGITDAVLEFGYIHTVYGFFRDEFEWRGTAGNDNQLQLLVHSATQTTAAFYWDPFGEAIQVDTGCASLDVTAHEFGHGIIQHSSGLVYNGVSGALNEGYADAMGVVVDDQDWLLAEDRSGFPGYYIRDFQDPTTAGQPDKLSDLCTSDDDCDYSSDSNGVHTNSGILNKAHYLIATGEAFNFNGTFPGIGRDKMGSLAFHTMRLLPSGATFQDARTYSVMAANFLAQEGIDGFIAADVCAVKNGFAAVEIGPADDNCDGIDDDVQDPDSDFALTPQDNCPNKFNPDQKDTDGDGIGNACDGDEDGDGIPDSIDNCASIANWDQWDTDDDGHGDACEQDDDDDGEGDYTDNCPKDPNPDQADGDGNGFGDACDADLDGDGYYADDNCTYVFNDPQLDTDGDLLGDACDLCPTVADWNGAYMTMKWQGANPVPLQHDSDEDGTPDACDSSPFGECSLAFDGEPFKPGRTFRPGDPASAAGIAGPPGGRVRIPVPVCDPDGDPDPAQITEIRMTGLDASVEARLLDDNGLGLGAVRPGAPGSDARGLRVTPDCARTYFLEFTLGAGFPGTEAFSIQSALVPGATANPWVTPGAALGPPEPLPDADGDGLADFFDSCPNVADPTGADADRDGFGDACDTCPGMPGADQTDGDRDGHGDVCDCAPSNPTLFTTPLEVSGVAFDADGTTLRWDPQGGPMQAPVTYDLLRGSAAGVPAGSGPEACLALGTPLAEFEDAAAPPSHGLFWYVVRAANGCGAGTYGEDSAGRSRTTAACP